MNSALLFIFFVQKGLSANAIHTHHTVQTWPQ